MNIKEELVQYYSRKSKHSNYQILPKILEPLLGKSDIMTNSRYERERLDYFLKHVDFDSATVIDIGGNSGYFTFEMLQAGAKSVRLYEGNKEHCDFVDLAAKVLQMDGLTVTNAYFPFDGNMTETYDIALLLNVLHHVGDDYDSNVLDVSRAKENITEQLKSMTTVAKTLIFQLGFNWQGNRNQGLFRGGTKREMIDYVEHAVAGSWTVKAVGIAVRKGNAIAYEELNEGNLERDDTLGEFLNRPIFIMESNS